MSVDCKKCGEALRGRYYECWNPDCESNKAAMEWYRANVHPECSFDRDTERFSRCDGHWKCLCEKESSK